MTSSGEIMAVESEAVPRRAVDGFSAEEDRGADGMGKRAVRVVQSKNQSAPVRQMTFDEFQQVLRRSRPYRNRAGDGDGRGD
jgi:hypothetical protein